MIVADSMMTALLGTSAMRPIFGDEAIIVGILRIASMVCVPEITFPNTV